MSESRVLFYDPYTTGHHLEYLRHLIVHSESFTNTQVLFVIAQSVISQLREVTKVDFESVPVLEFDGRNQIRKSMLEAKWLADVVEGQACTDLVLLTADPYQYALGTSVFKKMDCAIHGILFSPPHRLFSSRDAALKEKIVQSVRRVRKGLQLRWALSNKNLKTLYILDDSSGVKQLNKKFRPVFKYLPDPIEQLPMGFVSSGSSEVVQQKIILSFGSIADRKNLENIIESLQYLVDKVTLVIAGKGKPEYVEKLRLMAEVYDKNTDIKIVIDNRFIGDKEMSQLFAKADGIVMVYRNFYGSSGVLGHAAAYRKPVLVSNVGLIPALVTEYKMGYAVGQTPEAIAEGINLVIGKGLPRGYAGEKYLERKAVAHFAEALLSLY